MRRFTKRGGGWFTQLTGIRFGHLSTGEMKNRIKTMIQGDKRLFNAGYLSQIFEAAKTDKNLQNLKNILMSDKSITTNPIFQEKVYPLINAVKGGRSRRHHRSNVRVF